MGFLNDISRFVRGKGDYQSGASVDQKRAAMMQEYGGVDSLGFPTSGKNPPAEIADQVQLLAERNVAQRNAGLNQDALSALQGGLGQLQSYRPGGAAAMASPYYSQMAQVLQNSQTQAPDLLYNSRLQAQQKAKKAARQASNMQIAGAVISAAGAVLAPATGGASLLASTAINAGINAAGKNGSQSGNDGSSSALFGGPGNQNIVGGQGQQGQQGGQQGQPGQPPQIAPASAYGGQPSTQQSPASQPQNPGTMKSTLGGQGGQGEGGQQGFGGGGGGGYGLEGAQGGAAGGPQQSGGSAPMSAMLDPGASAFGPATPMGSSYPSREGIIAGGMARFGPASYDIAAQIYVRDFAHDGFYDRQLASLDAMDARIEALIG